ncbi:MAG TPA: aminodeoxychorismate/anthranilate synthase component II [Candidatus Saccharimonadales bacterium]|nr:aminodeoxychorismate/anthranilate synthase component II [Candidatus Saccharimonadales bacterium]
MILVIDNYDSFTYNLVQQIETLGHTCQVFANDKIALADIAERQPEKIVISPGPGGPARAGISSDVIKYFYKSTPILGVCLGHQCIGMNFGSELTHAKQIMHGKVSRIRHEGTKLFKGLPSPLNAARYHSLALKDVSDPLRLTASADDGTPMALEHRDYPLYGVQFHPESFLTPYGNKIIENFLNIR